MRWLVPLKKTKTNKITRVHSSCSFPSVVILEAVAPRCFHHLEDRFPGEPPNQGCLCENSNG